MFARSKEGAFWEVYVQDSPWLQCQAIYFHSQSLYRLLIFRRFLREVGFLIISAVGM